MQNVLRFLKFYLFLGRILYRLKIRGTENIPKQGACVIVYNHIAPIIDSMVGAVIMLNRPDSGTFGGQGLPRSGAIVNFMKRFNKKGLSGRTTILGAIKARGLSGIELLKALKILEEGRAVSLAAEGELSWDGRLQYPLAPGAAWMALRAHVPVVAVVSVGGYDIMPRWARLPKLTGRVTIRVGEPFYVHDETISRLSEETLTAANDLIYREMAKLMYH
jgi:1-acyl-sn-glycerol-3-phosphate acyltransferase